MKKVMAALLLSVSLTLGAVGTAPLAQAADRVRCEIPSNYRVICYNNTPYRVHVRLNIFTDNGLYTRYFTIFNYRKVVYSPAYIDRITWRWNY